MKYNCPDCTLNTQSCDGCPRVGKEINYGPLDIPDYSDTFYNYFRYVPDCCKYCSNHPINGGSGICNCTLPYMATTGELVKQEAQDGMFNI